MHHGRWKRPWSDPGMGRRYLFYVLVAAHGNQVAPGYRGKDSELCTCIQMLPWEGGSGSRTCVSISWPSVEWTRSELISSIFTRLYSSELLGLLPACPPKSEQLWVFVFHIFGFFWPNKFNFKNGRGGKKKIQQFKISWKLLFWHLICY